MNIAKDVERSDLLHVFDCFWCIDSARRQSGLGLSIARGMCEMLGIRLSVDLREGKRFEARLVVPATASPRNSPLH